jgi:DMSO/TMAO reductase YedYZ heme-binding membrane subunit
MGAFMLILSYLVQTEIMTMESTIFRLTQKITYPFLGNWEIMGAVNFTMFCLAAFSQERVEDEMMQAFRLRAITIIALISILTHIVAYISPDGSVAEDIALSMINDWMGDFGIIMVMYLILFKLIVSTNKWRMRNEE